MHRRLLTIKDIYCSRFGSASQTDHCTHCDDFDSCRRFLRLRLRHRQEGIVRFADYFRVLENASQRRRIAMDRLGNGWIGFEQELHPGNRLHRH